MSGPESWSSKSLLAALDRTDEGVGVAAAEALGRVGTAFAVAGLREAESASDDDGLRRAAREAIARIQERLTGASPGQLSLSPRARAASSASPRTRRAG